MITIIILTIISFISWITIIFFKQKYNLKISLCILNIIVNFIGFIIYLHLDKFTVAILCSISIIIWIYIAQLIIKLKKDNH